MAQQSGEQVEEGILATEDHRRLEDGPVELRSDDRRLGFALAALVAAGAVRVRIERTHLDEAPDAGGLAGGDAAPRHADVHVGKRLAPGLVEDADEVDHRIGAVGEPRQGFSVRRVRFVDFDRRQQDQVPCVIAATRGYDDAMAGRRQAPDDVASDEAAASHDKDGLLVHRAARFNWRPRRRSRCCH
jgi:hypothetical protein